MKVFSSLLFAGFALAAVPAMAQPGVCPAGMTATSMPSCEVGVAAFVDVYDVDGCFHVSVNDHDYAIVPSSATPGSNVNSDDAGAAALRDALILTKGQMRAFISSNNVLTTACVLPNVSSRPLGAIN